MEGHVGPDDKVAHQRVDAVGADHRIGARARAVGEGEIDLAGGVVDSGELLAEMDAVGGNGRGERVVQIGAVHAEIGRAKQAFRHRQLARHHAGVPDAVEVRVRREGDAAQALLDADAAQHLHRVRHHLNARADAREARRLLVDLRRDADPAQRRGDGEPAHVGADDGDRRFLLGHFRPNLCYAPERPDTRRFTGALAYSINIVRVRSTRAAGPYPTLIAALKRRLARAGAAEAPQNAGAGAALTL